MINKDQYGNTIQSERPVEEAARALLDEQEEKAFEELFKGDNGNEPKTIRTSAPGYERLEDILIAAYEQAAIGKGAQRHAQGAPFDQQPMQQLIQLYGVGFALGQAGKKAQESMRMDYEAARRELLGSIVYIAGAIIALEDKQPQ